MVGAEGYTTPKRAMDSATGGRGARHCTRPTARITRSAASTVQSNRARRLVFTWGWDDDNGTRGHETEVTVTFEPARRHPHGARATDLRDADTTAAANEHGWGSSLCVPRTEAMKPA